MKRVHFVLLLAFAIPAHAQLSQTIIKAGAGFTHDFPGLNGYTFSGEIAQPFGSYFEAGLGIKRVNLNGYPRSKTVNEYTRSSTIDFNAYFLPVQSESHILRIGIGYSFSFYKIRRSYPLIENDGAEKTTVWAVQDKKGRTSGAGISGEYEYIFPESSFSIGIRASIFKAYDRVSYIGPFVGVRI